MLDPNIHLLGKQPFKHNPNALLFANYKSAAYVPTPLRVDYSCGISDWGMMLNDRLGDCTIADGPGHATQVWTVNATGRMMTPPDSAIEQGYEFWCDYNPSNPDSDEGGCESDVLEDWRKIGRAHV